MSNDNMLQKAVIAELSWEPMVTSAHIGVTANSGVITLTGHVASFMEKHAAETAASRVKGVKAVAEEIEIKLAGDMRRTDDQIAAAALEGFAWDVSIPKDRIKVTVEKGWVSLTGEVDWHFQKDAAEHDVRRLFGVVGVSNQIVIKPLTRPSDVHEKIMTALNRSWFDPAHISVSAEGGVVQLDGNVRSWHERQLAETAAWGAPGVTHVQDNITIN
jgi:osmotically-inducible protein OsmY